MANRVVITGMGAVCPLGDNIAEIYENAKNGVCGIVPATMFDTEQINNVHFAGEVKDFDPSQYIAKREARRLDRFAQFAIYAGMQAFEDSGLAEYDPYRVGVILGSGMGGLETICEQNESMITSGMNTVSSLFIPKSIINLAAGSLAIKLNLNGLCYSVVSACASGTDAIGLAYQAVKNNQADAVLVGGAEAVIGNLGVQGFNQMGALSNSDKLERASIPFDKERNGFVMGEGAAFMLVESYEHAQKRNAHIYGEIAGFGQTCDANHITAPMEGGIHAARAMEMAVEEAGIAKEKVGYINAHGTGTPLNDKTETSAIITCFGDHSKSIAVSSTKSMTGHLLGAAGAIEAILTVMSLGESIALPTINYQIPDEECTLNYVPNKRQAISCEYAISNSLGFGGHNSSLLFKKG
ncbi:MAG: beta-ketoacyl-ACP synthase II [Clostridia bacterium]|nr:beta-ketoacyl-ACP synthase II [Clostridia bacterium]